jgi:hypothetical protein
VAIRAPVRTQLHEAPFMTAAADRPQVCACPCHYAGHRSSDVCRIKIEAGELFVTAFVDGERRRPVGVCGPCWESINGPIQRER